LELDDKGFEDLASRIAQDRSQALREGGHSLGEFLRQFPTVTHEMAVQALEEAKDSLLAKIA
jgi:uncharacterized protein (DUF433 family)